MLELVHQDRDAGWAGMQDARGLHPKLRLTTLNSVQNVVKHGPVTARDCDTAHKLACNNREGLRYCTQTTQLNSLSPNLLFVVCQPFHRAFISLPLLSRRRATFAHRSRMPSRQSSLGPRLLTTSLAGPGPQSATRAPIDPPINPLAVPQSPPARCTSLAHPILSPS